MPLGHIVWGLFWTLLHIFTQFCEQKLPAAFALKSVWKYTTLDGNVNLRGFHSRICVLVIFSGSRKLWRFPEILTREKWWPREPTSTDLPWERKPKMWLKIQGNFFFLSLNLFYVRPSVFAVYFCSQTCHNTNKIMTSV